jgi:hypothetical protein
LLPDFVSGKAQYAKRERIRDYFKKSFKIETKQNLKRNEKVYTQRDRRLEAGVHRWQRSQGRDLPVDNRSELDNGCWIWNCPPLQLLKRMS